MAKVEELDVEAVMRAAERRVELQHQIDKRLRSFGVRWVALTTAWRAALRTREGYDRERSVLLRVIKRERQEKADAIAEASKDAERVVDEFIAYRGAIFDALAEVDMALSQRSITAERKAELRCMIEVLKDRSLPATITRVYRARGDRAIDGIMESLDKLDAKP